MNMRSFIAAFPGTAITCVGAMLALAVFGVALVQWLNAAEAQRLAYLTLKQAETEAVALENGASLAKIAKPYESALINLERKLDSQFKEGQLLAGIQSAADASGARLGKFRMDARAPMGGYDIRAAYIDLDGEYPALRRFIAIVEDLPFAAVAGNAILERDPGTGRRIQMTLELVTFNREGKDNAGMP